MKQSFLFCFVFSESVVRITRKKDLHSEKLLKPENFILKMILKMNSFKGTLL